jgi:hypothetical protein
MTEPLKLRAVTIDDLAVISAMAQDALVPLADMALFADESRFVIALNRFRWEDQPQPTRTHSLLTVQNVERAQTRRLDRSNRDRILNLLSLTFEEQSMIVAFSGGGTLRLHITALDCMLEDVGDPWPAQAVPTHQDIK